MSVQRDRHPLSKRARVTWGIAAAAALVIAVAGIGIGKAVATANERAAQEARAAQTQQVDVDRPRIRIDVDIPSGASATGISVAITNGADYDQTIDVVSSGTGSVRPTEAGTYTVSIVPESLPSGYSVVSETSYDVRADVGEETVVTFTVDAPAPVPTAIPTVDPTIVAPPSADSAVWTLSTPSGYSYDVRVVVSAPTTGGSNGSTRDAVGDAAIPNTIGSGCTGFDPSVDVAIPVVATFTATTAGFETPVTANFQVGHVDGSTVTGIERAPASVSTVQIQSEQFYASGSTCEQWTGVYGTVNVNWETPLAQGRTTTFNLTVILKNYKSPNNPSGDPALLDWISVRPVTSNSSQSTVGTYSPTAGPRGLTLAGDSVN